MNDVVYGAVRSAEPVFTHTPEPAAARWNRTLATPESASAGAASSVIVPRRFAGGAVIVAVGETSSARKESRCASQRDEVSVAVLEPVEPAVAWMKLCDATLARAEVVDEAD